MNTFDREVQKNRRRDRIRQKNRHGMRIHDSARDLAILKRDKLERKS